MTQPPENQQQYGSILTVLGENAEQNGKLQNKQITFTHIAIGDANDTYVQPDRSQNALVNELARISVNSVDVLQPTPDSVPMLKVEAILPDDVNDLVIREFAAVAEFNGQSYFHAVGNCARIYVPPPVNNGNVLTPVTLEMIFVITSADPIVEIDPNVVTASREWVKNEIKDRIVSVLDYGAKFDGVSDDSHAFNKAMAESLIVQMPAGDTVISDDIIYKFSGQTLIGAGEAITRIFVKKDTGSIKLIPNYCELKQCSVFPHKDIVHAADLIEVGNPTGGGGSRTKLHELYVDGAGVDNIKIHDGNLGSIHNLTSLSAGRDGVHFTDDNPDNNAWTLTGRIDVRGNGRDGVHLAPGNGVSDSNAPKSHMLPSITAQQNGRHGVYVGTRNNTIWVYAEANGESDVYIDNVNGAEGNWIVTTEAQKIVFADPELEKNLDRNNFLVHNNFNARYARAFYNLLINEAFHIEKAGLAGKYHFQVTDNRKLQLMMNGSGGDGWLFEVATELPDKPATVKTDNFVGEISCAPIALNEDNPTPNIYGSNSFYFESSSEVIVTGFVGRRFGKEFSLMFDGLTTIKHNANIKLKSGADEKPANGELKKFICNPKNGLPYFIEL